MTETTDNFIPYLRLFIYVNILLRICNGVCGIVVSTVAVNPKDVGSLQSNCIFFNIYFFIIIIIIKVRFQH